MFSHRFLKFAAVLAAFAGGIGFTSAEDWPQWRGPLANGYLPAKNWTPEKLPATPNTLWKVGLGDGVGSPVVAGGRVFILEQPGEHEVLRAFEAATGKDLWKHEVDKAYGDTQGKGSRSTPSVSGNRIFVTSCRGEFQCLDVETGKVLWKKNFVTDYGALFYGETKDLLANGASRHGNNGSPILLGDSVIVQAGGTNGASIVSLNQATARENWRSENDQAGYAGALVTQIAGVNQAVFFTAHGVIGLSPNDGKLLWRFPIKTKFARHVTVPTVVDDIVMVSSHEHGIFGIRISKEGKGLKAEQAWLNKSAAINFSCPVIVGEHLYGLGPAKNIICLNPKTGEITWSKEGLISSAPTKAYVGMIVAGKNILMLTDTGTLIQFIADPKEYREISRAQVCGVNWTNPALADGVLYVRDGKFLSAISLK
jgi:outer membrane protein assembly factor BamB